MSAVVAVQSSTTSTPSVTCPPFEDKNSYNAGQGYTGTNEEPDVHRRLLKGMSFRRAASISSGGEVALFAILPHVGKELVLFDHSYQALSSSMTRALVLKDLGAKATKALFESGNQDEITGAFKKVTPLLPEGLKKYPFPQYPTSYYASADRREFHYTPLSVLRRVWSKLDKLSFVHGDFVDLKDKGPFDLLYISNATSHIGRTNSYPLRENIEALVKPGGYVLSTVNVNEGTHRWGWKQVKIVMGYRTSWPHILYQVGGM